MGITRKVLNYITQPQANYQPLIEVKVFKDALRHNLAEYKKQYPGLEFAPVLKSNAYGHGLVETAKILDGERAPFFMVDSFFEALVLRRAGIKTKILILGYCRVKQLLENSLERVSFGILDLQVLKELSSSLKRPLSVHVKVDTGMHRQGILPQEAEEAARLISENENILLEGVCTHFADADNLDESFTRKQIEVWKQAVEVFKRQFPRVKYFHAANTAGARFAKTSGTNTVRLGIGLYGLDTSPVRSMELRPALQMESVVSSVRKISAGERVGYGGTFEAKDVTVLATVPVGYNEGVDRRLSGKGFYKVGGRDCVLAGRVSMNMSSVDVSSVPGVKLEDRVVVISADPKDLNSVENISKVCGCLPYEILVHLPQYLRRTVL